MSQQVLQQNLQQYKNNVLFLEAKLAGLALVQAYLNSNYQSDYLTKAIQHFRTLQSGPAGPFTMNGITNENEFRQRVIYLTNSLHDNLIHFQTLITQTENQIFENLNLEIGGQTTFPPQAFGKKKRNISLQKKVMRLKHKKGISLKNAWNIVKKRENEKLKLMSLKKLRHLANKKNISITKRNSKKLVNKKILIKRIKKNKFGTCVTPATKQKHYRTTFGQSYELFGHGYISNRPLLYGK